MDLEKETESIFVHLLRNTVAYETSVTPTKSCSGTNQVNEYISKAVQGLMEHHNVTYFTIIYDGVTTFSNFLHGNQYRGTVFDVAALNKIPITEVVEVTDGKHLVAVILDAGQHNKDVYREIQNHNDLILNKLLIAIDENITDWNNIPRFGEKFIIVNPSEVTCSPQNEHSENVQVSIHYFSSESESIQNGIYWSSSKGLQLPKQDLWHFSRFQNKFFNVTSLDIQVLHYYNVDEKGAKHWDGIAVRLLQALSEALNFTFAIYETPDSKWGGIDPDGSWNGLVGQVKNGYADFAAAAMTLNHIRDTVVDYGQPFYMEPAVMVMRRPKEDKLLMFSWPLSSFVWLCMFFSLPTMATTVFLITCLHDNLSCDQRYLPRIYLHIQEGFTNAYGSAMRQSLPWLPNILSIRLLFTVWWFSVIIITAAYTGNLTAVLTVPRTPSPIDTLQELADQNVYKYGVLESSALHLLFSSGNNSDVYKRLYEKSMKNPKNLVKSTKEGLQRAKEENYVFMCERTEVIHYVYSDCSYIIGKEEFYPSSFAFIFQENSPYISVFNSKLMQLDTAGLLGYWITTQMPKNKCAFSDNSSADKKANLPDLHGAFVILCAGIFASSLTLLAEWLMVLRHKIRRTN